MYRLMTVSDKVRRAFGSGGHVLQGGTSESRRVGGERGGEHRARLVGTDRRDPRIVDADEFGALGEPTRRHERCRARRDPAGLEQHLDRDRIVVVSAFADVGREFGDVDR